MKLSEVVEQIDSLNDGALICVREPWTASAESCVTLPSDELGVPANVKVAGFLYFLEVNIAREVLGVFSGRHPTLDEKVRLLVHYAENDAYPDWAYDRANLDG